MFLPALGEGVLGLAAAVEVSRAALDAFAKAAAGGPAYPIPLDQMIHGAAVTEAIIRSASTAQVERVA
jgi:hypothetical protein